jgi:hypothetical protein
VVFYVTGCFFVAVLADNALVFGRQRKKRHQPLQAWVKTLRRNAAYLMITNSEGSQCFAETLVGVLADSEPVVVPDQPLRPFGERIAYLMGLFSGTEQAFSGTEQAFPGTEEVFSGTERPFRFTSKFFTLGNY